MKHFLENFFLQPTFGLTGCRPTYSQFSYKKCCLFIGNSFPLIFFNLKTRNFNIKILEFVLTFMKCPMRLWFEDDQ